MVLDKLWLRLLSLLRYYAILLLFFLLYLATIIFVGFLLKIDINSWTLVFGFISYIAICAIYFIFKKSKANKFYFLAVYALLTPLIFLLGTTYFSGTYDNSYDGQYYHAPAVISLANKWNPLYSVNFPIKTPQPGAEKLIVGGAKVGWAIEASIYKLTNNINSATFLNLLVSLISLIFAWEALRAMGVKTKWAFMLAALSVFTVTFVGELFSFRGDSLSYDFLVIGVAALIQLIKSKQKALYFSCLLAAIILTTGTKVSSLYALSALFLLVIISIIHFKLYRIKSLRVITVFGLAIAILTLANPYLTNVIDYHAANYPYNEKTFADSFRLNGVPYNIINDSKPELFFYGLFSASDILNIKKPAYYAKLKVPFSFNLQDLYIESDAYTKLVGGYGVLFSGIFILSLVAYIYLLFIKKNKKEKNLVIWLGIIMALILLTCLMIPIPNNSRYNSQLFLLPIGVTAVLLIVSKNRLDVAKIMAVAIIACLFTNIYLDAAIGLKAKANYFNIVNQQLKTLKESKKTYLVYSSLFYADYIEIKEHGVKIKVSDKPISCKNEITFDLSAYTELCPLVKS